MKKITKLSILISLNIPIFSILSCGKKVVDKINYVDRSNYDDKNDYITNNFKPLDYKIFEKYGKDQPVFYGGINYTAYSQGTSFVFNILKGLGWNWEDSEKIRKLYDHKFDFSTININKNSNSGFQKDHKLQEIEKKLQQYFSTHSGQKTLSQFIKDNTTKKKLVSKLYNQIKSLVYINQNNKKDHLKADASTKVEIELSSNFHRLNIKQQLQEIANKLNNCKIVEKIFQDKKYAYSWSGTVLDKLGFQIQKDKMVLWHMSENLPDIIKKRASIINLDKNLQKNIDTTPLKKDNQKNLNQVVIDPYGSRGTMPKRIFYTNLNLKNNGKKDIRSSKYFQNLPLISKGHGKFDWTGGFKKLKNKKDNLQKITSYSSFIDGDSPSSVILKMFSGKLTDGLQKQKVSYPLKAFNTRNQLQTFYKLKNEQKIDDMIRLIYTYIQFLKEQFDKKDEKINKIINFINNLGPPLIKSMFEFIRNNEITKDNVREQFHKYNNGSHYMLAVEIFLRGMKNIPSKFSSNYEMPPGIQLFIALQEQQRKSNEIVGLANVNNIIAIIFMMYSSNKKSAPSSSIFHFNPQTQDFDNQYSQDQESYKPINYFVKDLSSFKKQGEEIGHYKL